MRMVSIAVFLFCIHVAIAFINATGIYSVSVSPDQTWLDSLSQSQVGSAQYIPNQVANNVDFTLGDIAKGLFFFVTSFGLSIVVLPWTFMQFGVPLVYAAFLSAPFYLMYVFGIAQFIANRAEKSMG